MLPQVSHIARTAVTLAFLALALQGCSGNRDVDEGGVLDTLVAHDKDAIRSELSLLQDERDLRQELVAWILADKGPGGRPFAERQIRLLKRREAIAKARSALIQRYVAQGEAEKHRGLVEASLMTFVLHVRDHLGPSMRRWRAWALRDFSYVRVSRAGCQSDLVEDQVLFSLVRSIIEDDPARYASSLANVVRSIDCSSLYDALALNTALALAFSETIENFDKDEQKDVRRILTGSLLNLFVVVLDETKSVGVTKLYDWFKANKAAVREVIGEPSTPIGLAGLWLRDPSRNSLVQIEELCEHQPKSTEGCISGSLLIRALTDPRRLGPGGCALIEMASPKVDPAVGYLCQRNVCGESNPAMMSPTTSFGYATDSLIAARCPEGSDGGGSGWGQHGGGLVGIGGALPANALGCVTEPLGPDTPEGTMKCIADVTGKMGERPDMPLVDAAYTPREECRSGNPLAEGGDETKKKKVKEEGEKAAKELEEKKEENKKKANDSGHKVSDGDYEKGKEAAKNAKIVKDKDWKHGDKDANTNLKVGKDGKVVGGEITIKESAVDSVDVADLLKHEAMHVALSMGEKADSISADGQEDFITGSLGYGAKLCDDPEMCGGPCGAATETISKINECSVPSEIVEGEPFRLPKETINPSPIDDPDSVAWNTCFGTESEFGDTVDLACGLMDCGVNEFGAAKGGECICSARTSAGMPSRNTCAYINCPESEPVATETGCRCSSDQADALVEPPDLPFLGGDIFGGPGAM